NVSPPSVDLTTGTLVRTQGTPSSSRSYQVFLVKELSQVWGFIGVRLRDFTVRVVLWAVRPHLCPVGANNLLEGWLYQVSKTRFSRDTEYGEENIRNSV